MFVSLYGVPPFRRCMVDIIDVVKEQTKHMLSNRRTKQTASRTHPAVGTRHIIGTLVISCTRKK